MPKLLQQESQQDQQEEIFKCLACREVFEVKEEPQYILNGEVKGKNFSTKVKNAIICESCMCFIAEVEEV